MRVSTERVTGRFHYIDNFIAPKCAKGRLRQIERGVVL